VPRQFENRDLKLALQWQSEGRSPTTEIALPIETQRRSDGDEPYRGHYRLVIFLPDGSGKSREICERSRVWRNGLGQFRPLYTPSAAANPVK